MNNGTQPLNNGTPPLNNDIPPPNTPPPKSAITFGNSAMRKFTPNSVPNTAAAIARANFNRANPAVAAAAAANRRSSVTKRKRNFPRFNQLNAEPQPISPLPGRRPRVVTPKFGLNRPQAAAIERAAELNLTSNDPQLPQKVAERVARMEENRAAKRAKTVPPQAVAAPPQAAAAPPQAAAMTNFNPQFNPLLPLDFHMGTTPKPLGRGTLKRGTSVRQNAGKRRTHHKKHGTRRNHHKKHRTHRKRHARRN